MDGAGPAQGIGTSYRREVNRSTVNLGDPASRPAPFRGRQESVTRSRPVDREPMIPVCFASAPRQTLMLPGGSPPGIAPAASGRRGIDNREPGRQPLPGSRCFRRSLAARHAPSAQHSRSPVFLVDFAGLPALDGYFSVFGEYPFHTHSMAWGRNWACAVADAVLGPAAEQVLAHTWIMHELAADARVVSGRIARHGLREGSPQS